MGSADASEGPDPAPHRGADVGTALPPVIHGHQGETAVVICSNCQLDMRTYDACWAWCHCGAVLCRKCLDLPCTWCERGVRGSPRAAEVVLPRAPPGDTSHQPMIYDYDWHDIPCFHVDPAGLHDDVRGEDGFDGRCCAVCAADLSIACASWRICSCGANICLQCDMMRCPACEFAKAREEGQGTSDDAADGPVLESRCCSSCMTEVSTLACNGGFDCCGA